MFHCHALALMCFARWDMLSRFSSLRQIMILLRMGGKCSFLESGVCEGAVVSHLGHCQDIALSWDVWGAVRLGGPRWVASLRGLKRFLRSLCVASLLRGSRLVQGTWFMAVTQMLNWLAENPVFSGKAMEPLGKDWNVFSMCLLNVVYNGDAFDLPWTCLPHSLEKGLGSVGQRATVQELGQESGLREEEGQSLRVLLALTEGHREPRVAF